MSNFSRYGRTLGFTVAAAGLAGVGAVATLRRSLPQRRGRIVFDGLKGRAQVIRDRWGVPHIYAADRRDLMRALGFVHAQDRLWQMELNRRTGHGRLAEIFGPIALSSDRFIRTLGFSRIVRREAELLDDAIHSIIEAYVQGINHFIATHRSRLPLEFALLRFQPQPWAVVDVLVWSKMMALSLCGNWMSELLNARMLAAVGEARFEELAAHYPTDHPVKVPTGIRYPTNIGAGALRAAAAAAPFIGTPGLPQGSNAWVVGPERSRSGKPLLADDPHLGLALPGVWYEAHLEGGGLNVAGGTFPSMPMVVIGHNARIAWGVTNAMTDDQDLYIERLDPADRLRYQWQGEWQQAELVREEIVVKGQTAPVVEEVVVTRHGPLIDKIAAPETSALLGVADASAPFREALALQWTALQPDPRIYRAGMALNEARDWDEFRAALADWRVPPQNFVYADVDGHYGYALGGWLPIRANGDGRLPVPGWSGEYEWTGFIPSEALPAAFDPPEGYAVTANNRHTDAAYRYADQLRAEYLNGYRAARIAELLEATPRHDARSFGHIHSDVYSLPGLELAALVADLPLDDPREIRARDLLAAWNGELSAETVGGTIYSALRFQLEREAYAEVADLLRAQSGLGAFGSLPGNALLDRAFPSLLDRIAAAPAPGRADPWLRDGRTWDDVLRNALRAAVAELRAKLGDAPATWTYGRVHRLTLRHPLGSVPALATLFNRGPWPTGGDLDTVNQNYVPRLTAAGPVYNGPSIRLILDPSDWDKSSAILPAGQSGHPSSPHYLDMNPAWRTGDYHPMPWSRAAVERAAVGVLLLEPRDDRA